MGEPKADRPSALRDLKQSGAWRYLFYAFVVFGVGDLAYSGRLISYEVMLGLMAVCLALALGAGVEVRFYELKMQLRNIERMLEDVKNRRE
jgi:hypothetical protein